MSSIIGNGLYWASNRHYGLQHLYHAVLLLKIIETLETLSEQ